MYETKRKLINIQGRELPVFRREFHDVTSLSAIAGSEKDAVSRTKAYISIKDEDSTNWDISTDEDGIQIVMTGSAEVYNMIHALRFIADTLEDGLFGRSE